LARLADDVLTVSRIDRGKLAVDVHGLDVCRVVGATIGEVAGQMQVMPLSAWPVRNFRRARRHGAELVEVVSSAASRWVEIEVHDSGDGVDDAFAPHLFDRFIQAGDTGMGNGLGLFIVRSRYRRRAAACGMNMVITFLQHYVDIIGAIFNFVIVGAIIIQVRILRLPFTRTVGAAVMFFIVRGLSRWYDQPDIWPTQNDNLELGLDLFSIALLAYILLNVPRICRTLFAAVDEGRFRAREYDRALHHYTQVVRHRILNPITVVKGSAQTLRTGAVRDPSIHEQLCDVIIDMASEMERITLRPERRDALEHDLDALPHVEGHD
jgi:signal transduction histidine kinase